MSTPEKKLTPDAQVVFTKLNDGEAVLLHLVNGQYYTLNETGTRIWDLLQEGKSTADIASVIEAEYDVTPPEARQYVLGLLDELEQEGLVQQRADG